MKGKIIGITTAIVALVLAGFIFFKFYFVFGEGKVMNNSSFNN